MACVLKFKSYLLLFGLFTTMFLTSCNGEKKTDGKKPHPVIIGYVGGFKGLMNTEVIEAKKLTHINYAFVDIKEGEAFLTNEKTDSTNFRKLRHLKNENPDLQILISIGGWTWSENFSDAVLTDSSRGVFAKSAVDIIRKYDLDGVDIDWEYPGMRGEEGNVFRPEDKENYTLMFQAIREELDLLEKETGKKKLLTTAVAGFVSFLDVTEMGKAQQYLDYINLMTYDLFQGETVVHHAGLYASDKYKAEHSADKAVKAFMAAGVPAGKLVMGLPFYGRMFTVAEELEGGFGQKQSAQEYIDGYTYIKDSLVNKKGFKAYRDEVAKVPYLINLDTKQILNYEDEESVKEKCQYVLDNKMGGVMFWEYTSDPKSYLLNEIDKVFK
jgi:chitinase